MRKLIGITLMALACTLVALPAQAQLFKWGVKGGVNLSKIDWSGGAEGNKDNSTGFFAGPMVEITIPVVGLGIDGALLYSQCGEGDYKQQGVEIPINLKYTIGLGSTLGIFVAAGPDFFYNFKDLPNELTETKKNSEQVGINVGAGIKLLKHLQFGINYQFPLKDSFEKAQGKGKTKCWQVSMAVLF